MHDWNRGDGDKYGELIGFVIFVTLDDALDCFHCR